MKGTLDKHRSQSLAVLCQALKIQLPDLQGLHQALTHTSFANEAKHNGIVHNERLEFLGDAVLELVVSEYLFAHFPQYSEGELTKARARVVCETSLAESANRLGLGELLLLGKGEEHSGGRRRPSILADAFEAVIGTIFIGSGLDSARGFILQHLEPAFQSVGNNIFMRDYKTLLQEHLQQAGEVKISYEVICESGPDHNKTFEIVVTVNHEELGYGVGKSKKEAEQSAAKQALTKLKVI